MTAPEREGEGDDAKIKALHEMCQRGYEVPEEKARAVALAKRCHFLVSCHYPDYRDSFVASAEGDMIERILCALLAADETWESASVKAVLEFRADRQLKRNMEVNR